MYGTSSEQVLDYSFVTFFYSLGDLVDYEIEIYVSSSLVPGYYRLFFNRCQEFVQPTLESSNNDFIFFLTLTALAAKYDLISLLA